MAGSGTGSVTNCLYVLIYCSHKFLGNITMHLFERWTWDADDIGDIVMTDYKLVIARITDQDLHINGKLAILQSISYNRNGQQSHLFIVLFRCFVETGVPFLFGNSNFIYQH